MTEPKPGVQLKNKTWNRVQRMGLMPGLRRARGLLLREAARWIDGGCASPAPTTVKIAIVRGLTIGSGAKRFIETGTFLGGTVEVIARTGMRCQTIEIDPVLHKRAMEVLGHRRNIEFILGDSGIEMKKLLIELDEPAVFWLDGHFSGGVTGRSHEDTPISAELEAILNHSVKGHTILIDDAREFTGTSGYPGLSRLLGLFDDNPDYKAEVSCDIIRITSR